MKIALAAAFSAITIFCWGQTTLCKEHQPAARQAAVFIKALQQQLDIPGISVCVGNTQKILWAEAFGVADLENSTPLTIHSKFRIGSVSKCLTALAIATLHQQGKLALDTPVQVYVPHFPAKKYPVTVRQLAGHTAGIRHYRLGEHLHPARYGSTDAALALFANDSLLFEPGTTYAYSTYGYTLISAVVESISKTPFLTYMKQEVLAPLQMTNTIPDHNDSIIAARVRFYDDYGRGTVNARLVDNSYKWAGGGYLSTPIDLVKMGRELLTPTVLTPETVGLMLTPQRLKNGTQNIAGITWRVETDSQGRRIVHHGGAIEGGRAFIIVYPEQGLVIAICANKGVAPAINTKEMETIAGFFLQP